MRSKPLISDVNTENTMTIYIDADACPVTRIAESIARKHGIPVILLCNLQTMAFSRRSRG